MKISRFTDPITVAQARTQFEQWLHSARDEMVMTATAEQLVRRYRMPPRELEAKLLARQDVIRRKSIDLPI